jgi:phosphatidylglycerophosphate synthase
MLSAMPEEPSTVGPVRPDRPTMAELRAVAQPPTVLGRRNSEHWAGALYLRKGSIYLTRLLLPTGISANAVTWWIGVIGVLGAAVMIFPGWWPFLAAAALVQLSIMVDCTDGEIARWRRQSSATGVYIDRICHYAVEASLPVGFGIHLDGGFQHLGGWTIIGMATSILVLLKKAFGDLVHVARAYQGFPKLSEDAEIAAPRSEGLRSLRGLLRFFPFFRAFGAIEYTLILFVVATADLVLQWIGVEMPNGPWARIGAPPPLAPEFLLRVWAVAQLPLAALTAGGYLLSILMSSRLRPPAESGAGGGV